MIAFMRTQDQVALLADSVAAFIDAVDLSSLQYKKGDVDSQRVLDAQQNLVRQQNNLVATTGVVVLALVGFYMALGGGWEIRLGRDFVPREIKEEMENRTDWGDLLSLEEAVEPPPSEEVDHLFNRPNW